MEPSSVSPAWQGLNIAFFLYFFFFFYEPQLGSRHEQVSQKEILLKRLIAFSKFKGKIAIICILQIQPCLL